MNQQTNKIKDIVYIPLFSLLIACCALITVPFVIPFTMQLFGVFVALIFLGGKRGFLSILLYILLGALGLPVFSAGSGGIGVLFGLQGGYIFGFLLSAIIYICFEKYATSNIKLGVLLSFCLLGCYTVGTLQFTIIHFSNGNSETPFAILFSCVLIYLLPDLIKIALAIFVSKKMKSLSKKYKG